jgi:hypothetical protein
MLQALAGRGWWGSDESSAQFPVRPTPLQRVDYLSTVSGGGYIGGFLGQLFCRNGQHARADTHVIAALNSAKRGSFGPLNFLRENGRYLSPNGSGDLWVAAAAMLRNWFALQGVLSIFFAVPFLTWILLRTLLLFSWEAAEPRWFQGLYFSSLIVAPLVVLVVWAIPAGIAYWLIPGPRDRARILGPWGTLGIVGTLEAAVAALSHYGLKIPFAGLRLTLGAWWQYAAAIAAGLTAIAAVFSLIGGQIDARAEAQRRRLSVWLKTGLLAFLALLALAIADASGQTLYVLVREQGLTAAFASVATVVVLPASGQKLMALLPSGTKHSRLRLPITGLAGLVALVVGFVWLTTIAALCYAVAWKGDPVDTEAACRLVAEHDTTPPSACCCLAQAMTVVSRSCPAGVAYGTPDWLPVTVALALSLIFSGLFGSFMTFVNQSSHASLYSARLTRAYLGASNPERLEGNSAALTQVIAGDDRPMSEYAPHAHGGPLHFINVTLNETMDGRSQIEQRDRKGMGLAVGPIGISVGVRHHARRLSATDTTAAAPGSHQSTSEPSHHSMKLEPFASALPHTEASTQAPRFRVFQPLQGASHIDAEALSLGRWIGISGAAVSTGLGSRTSLGFSFLCGFFNLRLGYWWWSGTEPCERNVGKRRWTLGHLLSRGFPAQVHLLHEFLARFPGTQSRYWYLSDGGHFENTGAYELIRRRTPLMVVSDVGADEACEFADLGALVRKARLDFQAEITFFTHQELNRALTPEARRYVGTLEELRGSMGEDGRRTVSAYAALAHVRYDGKAEVESLLLYVKPGLLKDGDEPTDVKQYASTHQAFPHESTGDQFFDEAQWESYRCLGEHIGRSLLCARVPASADSRWHPAMLWNGSKRLVSETLEFFSA